jgi:hypothetical protein
VNALQRAAASARHGGSTVEISPGVEWLDRITGRAAVDPRYRELLFTQPSLVLTGEPLPAGLTAALCTIKTRDLSEYARLALEALAAHLAPFESRRPLEAVETPGDAEPALAWAAA